MSRPSASPPWLGLLHTPHLRALASRLAPSSHATNHVLLLSVSLAFFSLSHSLTISYSPPQSEFQFHICSHFQSPCSFPSLCPPSTLPPPPLLPLPLPLPLTLTFLLILLPFLPLLLPNPSLSLPLSTPRLTHNVCLREAASTS